MNIRSLITLFLFAFCTVSLKAAEVKAAAAATIASEEVDAKKQSAFEESENNYFKQIQEKFNIPCNIPFCISPNHCLECHHNASKVVIVLANVLERDIFDQCCSVVLLGKKPDENMEYYGAYENFLKTQLYSSLTTPGTKPSDELFYIQRRHIVGDDYSIEHTLVIQKRCNGESTGWRIYQSNVGLNERTTDYYSLKEWMDGVPPKSTTTDTLETIFKQFAGRRILTEKQLKEFMHNCVNFDPSQIKPGNHIQYYIRKFSVPSVKTA